MDEEVDMEETAAVISKEKALNTIDLLKTYGKKYGLWWKGVWKGLQIRYIWNPILLILKTDRYIYFDFNAKTISNCQSNLFIFICCDGRVGGRLVLVGP